MSAFGGDSWAREGQYIKRRVDDLMLSSSSSSSLSSSSSSSTSSSYKQLSNGKFACLLCPHKPILDSPLALSMHAKGSRHIAAVSRLKEKDLSIQEELNKRIALSSDSVTASNSTPTELIKGTKVYNQPLIEQTRKVILETQCKRSWDQIARLGSSGQKQITDHSSFDSKVSTCNHVLEASKKTRFEELPESREVKSVVVTEAASKLLTDWNDELHKHREKELKFTAAGWKRDGFGKWYKDENVEFDSDEEDPNDSLN